MTVYLLYTTHRDQPQPQSLNTFDSYTEAGFLVAVLDVGTIFEIKFQGVRAQNISFWPVESDFLCPNYSRKLVKYTFTLVSGPGHDLGTISETIKKPASALILVFVACTFFSVIGPTANQSLV